MEKLSQNKIKLLKKLKSKSARQEQGLFLVEGAHLIMEAFSKGVLIEVYALKQQHFAAPLFLVDEKTMKQICSTDSLAPVVGLCRYFKLQPLKNDKILVLDNLQDPGNVGTLIRSACAFNFDAIYLYGNCVDWLNDKVIRASQGAIFHIPVLKKELEDIQILAKTNPLIIADVKGEKAPIFNKPLALVIGNESRGVSKEIADLSNNLVKIPINDKIESLNAAVAGSILLYLLGDL